MRFVNGILLGLGMYGVAFAGTPAIGDRVHVTFRGVGGVAVPAVASDAPRTLDQEDPQ